MGIKDFKGGFHEALREIQAREVGLFPEGIEVGNSRSLR